MKGLAASFRFDDPALEAQFEAQQRPLVIRLFTLWCVAQCVLLASSLATGFMVFGVSRVSLVLCCGQVSVQAYLITVACLVKIRAVGRHSVFLLCSSSVLLLGWSGWMIHVLSRGLVEYAKQEQIPEVWVLVQKTLPSSDPFEAFLQKELSGKILLLYLLFDFLILDLIRLVGSLRWVAGTCAALPLVFLTTIFVSSDVSNETHEMMAASLGLSIYAFFSSSYIIGMRRRQFELSQQVESLLRRETATLRQSHEAEAAQKEAAQQADSVLNHILKNIMADATGCIDLALPAAPAECRAELQRAVTCLARGMKWCRGRQAMLMVAQQSYHPVEVPVNLQEFGESLVQGRQVVSLFPDEIVLLDPTLCDIICENALANATRHGHPQDPDIHFSVEVTPSADPADPRRVVTFRVANRPHPARPRVTAEFVRRVLAEDRPRVPHSAAVSEGLGLKHLFAAAKALGMTVHLGQEGEVVVFSAAWATGVGSPDPVPQSPTDHNQAGAFPSPLRILCLDDSDVSRRILQHALTTQAPRAEVLTFGYVASDIDLFKREALRGADILVLDQNLDYSDIHVLGTVVVRSLVLRGFTGFICIRSANVSPEDVAVYRACGAHHVVGKDVRAPRMVELLLQAYAGHRRIDPPGSRAGSPELSAHLSDDLLLPRTASLRVTADPCTAELSHSQTDETLPPGVLNVDSSFYLGIVSPRNQLQTSRACGRPLPCRSPGDDAPSSSLQLPDSRDPTTLDLSHSRSDCTFTPGPPSDRNDSSWIITPRNVRGTNHRRSCFDPLSPA